MKRYWMDTETYDGSSYIAHPVKDSDGDWVRYSDAQAEIARLQAEVDYWKGYISSANHQRDAANARASNAHNAAIDAAAAQVTLGDTVTNTQRKILALKRPVSGNRGGA